jgi:uncharacterized protein YjbK
MKKKTFSDELISSLPLNRFIEKMIINAAHFDVAGLLENIARQNKAVKEVICLGENLYLNENDIQMLQRELQQNHILESIHLPCLLLGKCMVSFIPYVKIHTILQRSAPW